MITKNPELANLPRSVRWRIQLGIFLDPSQADPTASTTLDFVYKWNQAAISEHNARFQELMAKYVEEEVEDEHEEGEASAAPPAPAEIDPLTAMVREQEARETRKAELYLKYRKEKARRKRGLTTEGAGSPGGENDGIDRVSVSAVKRRKICAGLQVSI
jgi:hypothetical protein